MRVDLGLRPRPARRSAGSSRSPSAGSRPGRRGAAAGLRAAPPRRPGSSPRRPPRGRATSSWIASAIWVQVSRRGWSSRTNDHCRIVTGPGEHALHRALGQRLRVLPPAHGHRRGPRRRRRTGSAASRSGCRRTAPSRAAEKAKPSSCSPKYSTMSLRSGSPCTSTSRPSASCSRDRPPRSARSRNALVGRVVELAGAVAAPRVADLRGLRERADRGGRQLGQPEPLALRVEALRRAARSARSRARPQRRARGGAPRRRWCGATSAARDDPPARAGRAARRARRVRVERAGEQRQLVELLARRTRASARSSGSRSVSRARAVRDVQQRARRRDRQPLAADRAPPRGRAGRARGRGRRPTRCGRRSRPPTAARRAGSASSTASSCSGARTRSTCSSAERQLARCARARRSSSPSK